VLGQELPYQDDPPVAVEDLGRGVEFLQDAVCMRREDLDRRPLYRIDPLGDGVLEFLCARRVAIEDEHTIGAVGGDEILVA